MTSVIAFAAKNYARHAEQHLRNSLFNLTLADYPKTKLCQMCSANTSASIIASVVAFAPQNYAGYAEQRL